MKAKYVFQYRNKQLNLPEMTENDKIGYVPYYIYPAFFESAQEADNAARQVHPEWQGKGMSYNVVAFMVEELQ